jgi:hypothetical protein
MLRTAVIRQFLPFPSERPMGDSVAHFDRAINSNRLLRLAISERMVRHLGNSLDEQTLVEIPQKVKEITGAIDATARISPPSGQRWFMRKPVRRLLLSIYDRIFRLYYG